MALVSSCSSLSLNFDSAGRVPFYARHIPRTHCNRNAQLPSLRHLSERHACVRDDDAPPSINAAPHDEFVGNQLVKDGSCKQDTREEIDAIEAQFYLSDGDSKDEDAMAEQLDKLEDVVMERDEGRSASDYSRRAGIFGRSSEVFMARRKEDDGQQNVGVAGL